MGMKDDMKGPAKPQSAAPAPGADIKTGQQPINVYVGEQDKDKDKKKPIRGLQAFRNA
jgi:hypothetical protein